MLPTVDPLTGRVLLLPKPKSSGGGGSGGGGPIFATVQIVSALPASAANGSMVFLTSDSTLYVYNNGWIALSGSGGGVGSGVDNMLLETNDNLLLETGDVLLLE